MGTRCITEIRSRWEDETEHRTLAIVYRHWDGYLAGHGRWLHKFLDGLSVVNGIGSNMPARFANGPGRVAAMLVADLHKDGHDPSLEHHMPDMDYGQEYHYQVDISFGTNGGTVTVRVFDGPVTFFGLGGEECTHRVFEGTVSEYGRFLDMEEERSV